ncbi:hypothetical protein [Brevundimonas vesicularis]|uniref:Uncharacterized protein n=1 Tax=Brevundimonas vesicularis TaxID=41276 RepID=A0A1Z3U572_BREVE|nr:hypothetical protein [Brevundimonas vesicularis]ASE38439.1 hypothetical protein CEP68_02370 [Brevundimonas vesicularis]
MSDHSITSLIEKLEGAEGPSIVLDAEICWTLERPRAIQAFWRGAMGKPGPLPDEFSRLPRGLGMASLEVGSPNYTASLDAALALAERVLPGHDWSLGHLPTSDDADHQEHHEFGCFFYAHPHVASRQDGLGHGATAPLAMVTAILRAHSEARV